MNISSLQAYTLPHSQPTLNLLTEEELKQLEHVWVELSVWQRNQAY
ncbi:3-demethylubiquinone-9 3-methyltransferase [Vibrio kasasachensis]